MYVRQWGSIFIGRKLLFRLFLTLGLLPVVVLALFFAPLIWAILGLVAWFVFTVLSYRTTWRYVEQLLCAHGFTTESE